MSAVLELLDWRRKVAALYADVRLLRADDPEAAHARWRAGRDALFGGHPQSPLEPTDRERFRGLDCFAYDPAFAFNAILDSEVEPERFEIGTSGGGAMAFERCGSVLLPLGRLEVFWLDAYGGGLFVPFRDATAGSETYGGGRYLLDTVKGADLGSDPDGGLILDFNFSYHPSCSYSPAWSCPLAPPGNWLEDRVTAGERSAPTGGGITPSGRSR